MIPETSGAFLALLGLIAPGLTFVMRRERRQPAEKETAFREVSHVALTSLAFTVLALAVLVPMSLAVSWLPDIGDWLANPSTYLAEHYLLVGLFTLLLLILSCGFALIFEELTGRDQEQSLTTWGVWYHVLNRTKPEGTYRVWLWVTTKDGTQFKGPLRAYTPEEDTHMRDLALGGSPMSKLSPGADPMTGWVDLKPIDAVVISGAQLSHVTVEYLSHDGRSLSAAPPPRPKSWLPRRRARNSRVPASHPSEPLDQNGSRASASASPAPEPAPWLARQCRSGRGAGVRCRAAAAS